MSIEDEVRAIVEHLLHSQGQIQARGLYQSNATRSERINETVTALMRLMEPKLTAEEITEAERLRQMMLDTVDEYERKQEEAAENTK